MSDLKLNNILDNYKPKPNKDWQLHWLDDQPMLFSKSYEGLHLLNPVAGFIWTCCDGKTEVRAIRDALQEVFINNQNEVTKDFIDILIFWKNQGLIYFDVQLISHNIQVAYLIIAHNQPAHLANLINTLNCEWAYFFIHVDRKANLENFKKIIPANKKVIFLEGEQRIKVYWSGFTMITTILNLLKSAVNFGEHFHRYCLLSGSDFPIKSLEFIKNQFLFNKEFIRIDRRLGSLDKNTYKHCVDHYHFMDTDNPSVDKITKRPEYKKIVFYHGSTWWSLTEPCIKYILDFVNKNSDYIDFHKYTFCPDEIFFHSIIKNSPFAINITHDFEIVSSVGNFLVLNEHGCHYIDWNITGVSLPKLLDINDINNLLNTTACFARKFDEKKSTKLINKITEINENLLDFKI